MMQPMMLGVGIYHRQFVLPPNPMKSTVDAVKNAATDYATYDPKQILVD